MGCRLRNIAEKFQEEQKNAAKDTQGAADEYREGRRR